MTQDNDIEPDNIRIRLLMEDPTLGEEGKQFHKRLEITQYRIDSSSVSDRDQLEIAMRKMAAAVVDEWDEEQRDR